MKHLIIAAVAAAFLVSCAEPEATTEEVFKSINEEVLANSKGYDDLKEATSTIGHRLTGTENGAKGEEFAYNLFKRYGYEDTQYQEFEVESWARKSVSLTVSGSDSVTLDLEVVSLAHSPVKVDVTGELIYLQSALREQFEAVKDSVKGKIVLANIGLEPADSAKKNLHRSEKAALAIEYGAAALILFNKVEGRVLLTGTASVTGELISIPAVNIAYEDGQQLKALLDSGKTLTAHVQMENTSDKIKARNVIATLKGSEKPEETIIVCGHLDSWDLATGAIDNGIGSFTVIDIARTFKALNIRPKRTFKFVMFMGEEQGLHGSKHMAAEMIEDGTIERVKYVLNLDMSGNPKGFNYSGRHEMKEFFEKTGELIASVDSTFANETGDRAGLHSDHFPFMLEGIPVMRPVNNMDRSIYKYYHSNGDDFHLVNKTDMVNCTRYCAMMLYALDRLGTIPAQKLSDEATRQFFIDNGFKEEMVIGKSWKWDI